MAAFTWNSGGAWQGKPWTADLPTDSAILLYLFAAFLEAPRWQFPVSEPAPQPSTGGPLYLGSLPSRPSEFCYAILPIRPAALSKVRIRCPAARLLGGACLAGPPTFLGKLDPGRNPVLLGPGSRQFRALMRFVRPQPFQLSHAVWCHQHAMRRAM